MATHPHTSKETALITGSSSGIGYHLAREFARNGHPVILVAPVKSELERVAAEIRQEFRVNADVVSCDLAQEDAAEQIWDEISDAGLSVEILCNNAGLGRRGKFWEIPVTDDIEMLRVNAEAVVRLTKRFLPRMIAAGRGRILNTASVAGFEPGPFLAVYHATKAFVLSLSEALATELKDSGVTVTALCPGPVDTDFFPKADMVDTKAFQKGNVMAPQEVAEAAYKAVMDGERVIVPGAINKAMVFTRRVLPEAAQAKQNEKMYEETDLAERKRERGDVETKAAVDELTDNRRR
jgi:short-subunit dehydrogenase